MKVGNARGKPNINNTQSFKKNNSVDYGRFIKNELTLGELANLSLSDLVACVNYESQSIYASLRQKEELKSKEIKR